MDSTIKDMVNKYVISGKRVINILSLGEMEDDGVERIPVKYRAWGDGSNGEVAEKKLDRFGIMLLEGSTIYDDLSIAVLNL